MNCLRIDFTVSCLLSLLLFLIPILIPCFKRKKIWLTIVFYVFAVISLNVGIVCGFNGQEMYDNLAQAIISHVFLALSVIVFFSGVIATLRSRQLRLLIFFGFTVSSTFLLQISLCVAGISEPFSYNYLIGGIVQVVSQTLQTISLDLNYTGIIEEGFKFFNGNSGYIYITMACILTVVAPVSGGCALFDLISHLFPKAELFLLGFKHTRYVFSELNERSIETAESIYQSILEGKKDVDHSSIIIFTDAYTDNEEERSSELLVRAKKIGAICLREDVRELKLKWWFFIRKRKVCYFLMDKKEEDNISAAVALMSANERVNPWIKVVKRKRRKSSYVSSIEQKVEMFVFTSSQEANNIIDDARKAFNDKHNIEVRFKVINEYKNLVYHLIDGYCCTKDAVANRYNYPLYWSLLKVDNKNADLEKLSVVIVGGGRIGKEFFKAAYWCGQMLASTKVRKKGSVLPYKPTNLSITVIDKNATQTQRHLCFEMPEVFDKKYNSYCTFHFYNAEYGEAGGKTKDFLGVFSEHCGKADYVLVALGNDELNLQAAHWIKRKLDLINVSEPKYIPVNYVIEDAEMLNALVFELKQTNGRGCILNPFGSLKEHYSLDNIKMTEVEKRAYSINQAHNSEKENIFIKEEYQRNSSIASAMHLPYKLVSYLDSGEIRKLANSGTINQLEGLKTIVESKDGIKALYWLEHRRWCAYQRINGMRCYTAKEFFNLAFDTNNNFINDKQKELELYLHSCLVESGIEKVSLEEMKGYSYSKNKKDYIKDGKKAADDKDLEEWLKSEINCKENPDLDALDKLSWLIDKSFKDNDVNVILSLCADDYRRNILNDVEHLLGDDGANNYIDLVNKFIELYDTIRASQPQSCKLGDFISIDNINFYRLGIYKGLELAIIKNKDGAGISADGVLSELKKCFGGSDDEQDKIRAASFEEYLEENTKTEAVNAATKEWNVLKKLIDSCKMIDNLKHASPSKAFIISIKSDQGGEQNYAFLGLPLTVSVKKQQEISVSFKLLSCTIAASHKPVANSDEGSEAASEAATADGEKGDVK